MWQVLCRVVNNIKPGTIPKIADSPSSFHQLNNITMFLRAARLLGVRSTRCFDAVRQADIFVVVNLRADGLSLLPIAVVTTTMAVVTTTTAR